MSSLLAWTTERGHTLLALLSTWLVLTSPWVAMLRSVPDDAGWLTYAHVGLGLITLLLAAAYAVALARGGGWRTYFPWLSGRLGVVGRDVLGLAKGRVPAAENGGLFAAVEGALLLLLLATAATGAVWLAVQGTPAALEWRAWHMLAAKFMLGALLLHVISVSLHLVELMRS